MSTIPPTQPDIYRGSLFSTDFLIDSITRLPDWSALDHGMLDTLAKSLAQVFAAFPMAQTPNESTTEDDLIWPILKALGWTDSLRQQNLAPNGRDDVPDGLLFANAAAKAKANKATKEAKRYEHGLAIVESKRWSRPLDRGSSRREEETAPSTQMLRYLRRADDLTTGKLRWGVLTNGGRWRLYYQGARSVAEQFFELDLPAVLGIEGHDGGLFALKDDERRHWLKIFILAFGRLSFLGTSSDQRTFHQRALAEGKFYEERVAANLSKLVFEEVFPTLGRAIAAAAPDASMADVREAALILLYRLLFILYAEDRDLLPVRDSRYDDYGLRERVRGDVGRRKDQDDTFSDTAARYWSSLDDLSRAIDKGDGSIGLPPYNGGLFDRERTPLLADIRLSDAVMADVIDALSFEQQEDGPRRYINYRDLNVQQLGSIYERLLEHELVRVGDGVEVRPNIFARKGSGSYYTPDDLVNLIIAETIQPFIDDRFAVFKAEAERISKLKLPEEVRLGMLSESDPGEKLLELRICDPAMGSGHFLVALVDYLTDRIISAVAEAQALVTWGAYTSRLGRRVEDIRNRILANADKYKWAMDHRNLDDRNIIRRMVLKRCIYGVDKNPMAVELAKVALWLHTFTVGAPLSFLDHHLRCGDSLFGSWVRAGMDKADKIGSPLFLHEPMRDALSAAKGMQVIERLTDIEIAEAQYSASAFKDVVYKTETLKQLLSLQTALEWLELDHGDTLMLFQAFLTSQFGVPGKIATGRPREGFETISRMTKAEEERFNALLARLNAFIAKEPLIHWQVTFPGVWDIWESNERHGGFDAVIGNPPWDRVKLQQVEWFAARRREIALAQRASDRKRMIEALETAGDPLSADYAQAAERAEAGLRMARASGDYPLLSGGDVNLYSLFVERAMQLVKPDGIVGLLTPSGIASDKTAAPFFKGISTGGRLKALYDFENKKVFFPDVHASFKFCVFVASPARKFAQAQCSFYLHNVKELADPERCFPLGAADFARVNPNTGTAPIFRTRRDAALTTAIYGRLPVLVNRSGGGEVKAWPVRYSTMFHMTNDSGLFRTRTELEETEGAYPVGGNRYKSPSGDWLPLYVGRMIHQFDHRAASVQINEENLHNAAFSGDVSAQQKADPKFVPTPQYWVNASNIEFPQGLEWTIAFRDIARATDVRTVIAAAVPIAGFGNKLPLLLPTEIAAYRMAASGLIANLNSLVFDYVARSKIHSTSMNWYLVEQLPVVPPATYDTTRFGTKTAAEIVREAVLELTYTAHDMAPFARDLGYVTAKGAVRPPFKWDDARRLRLRAKLDAVYFHLYGVTGRDDVRYIYSTFPIVEREETAAHGRYLTRDLCLAWISALAAGDPDADIEAGVA